MSDESSTTSESDSESDESDFIAGSTTDEDSEDVTSSGKSSSKSESESDSSKEETGRAKRQSATWKPFGPDAIVLGKVVVRGLCDPNNFASVIDKDAPDQETKKIVEGWIDSGKYIRDNIRRNYNKTVYEINLYIKKKKGLLLKYPKFVRAVNIEHLAGTGEGLPNYREGRKAADMGKSTKKGGASTKKAPAAKKPSKKEAPKKTKRPDTVVGGGGGDAPRRAKAINVDSDDDGGLSGMMADVHLGEDKLPRDMPKPRLVFCVDKRKDPQFKKYPARRRLNIVGWLAPGMSWGDLEFRILNEGCDSVILVRWQINVENMDAAFLLGPDNQEDETFCSSFAACVEGLPLSVEMKFKVPFRLEPYFRLPGRKLQIAEPEDCLFRWVSNEKNSLIPHHMCRTCVFEQIKTNDRVTNRRQKGFHVKDYTGRRAEPDTPTARAYASDSPSPVKKEKKKKKHKKKEKRSRRRSHSAAPTVHRDDTSRSSRERRRAEYESFMNSTRPREGRGASGSGFGSGFGPGYDPNVPKARSSRSNQGEPHASANMKQPARPSGNASQQPKVTPSKLKIPRVFTVNQDDDDTPMTNESASPHVAPPRRTKVTSSPSTATAKADKADKGIGSYHFGFDEGNVHGKRVQQGSHPDEPPLKTSSFEDDGDSEDKNAVTPSEDSRQQDGFDWLKMNEFDALDEGNNDDSSDSDSSTTSSSSSSSSTDSEDEEDNYRHHKGM